MKFTDLLYLVEKPTRYLGCEMNAVVKENPEITFGFGFPDVYEVGMSHLGMHILYGLINNLEYASCERVFTPWIDMEALMVEHNITLPTLETKTPVNELDILGFTLQYELSYTNILHMMKLGNIPLRTKDRNENDPLIIAGGPCGFNPEPISPFMDAILIGEGEEATIEIIDMVRTAKKMGWDRTQLLLALASIDGVYVPSLYDVTYNEDGTIKERIALHEGIPMTITKRIIRDMDTVYYHDTNVIAFGDTVHDRAMIETFRGCTRGCRFCQAGMIYRPIREKSMETIERQAKTLIDNTGYEEFSLASLSSLDYTNAEELIKRLVARFEDDRVGLSLPSLRLDGFSVDVIKEIQKVRKTGLTFAPEAGSQRMRDVINKGVTEDDLRNTLTDIFQAGWNKVKLYFMIGLPTETEDDLMGIVELGRLGVYLYRQLPSEMKQRGLMMTMSSSCFVPKPFTPFQWMAQNTIDEFKEKAKFLKENLNMRAVRYNYHDPSTSVLEGVFARGDRRLADVIELAVEKGCKFDGWNEFFDYSKWREAFDELNIDDNFYTHRERSYEEVLPWDFIDTGVSKAYLKLENERSINAEVTADCRQTCTGCGVNVTFDGGIC